MTKLLAAIQNCCHSLFPSKRKQTSKSKRKNQNITFQDIRDNWRNHPENQEIAEELKDEFIDDLHKEGFGDIEHVVTSFDYMKQDYTKAQVILATEMLAEKSGINAELLPEKSNETCWVVRFYAPGMQALMDLSLDD